MIIIAFPKCCRAIIIYDFGLGHLGENPNESSSYEQVKKFLLEQLPKQKGPGFGICVVFACPTTTQPGAIKALLEQGFITTTQPAEYEFKPMVDYGNGNKPQYGATLTHGIVPMMLDLTRWKPVE